MVGLKPHPTSEHQAKVSKAPKKQKTPTRGGRVGVDPAIRSRSQ